MTRDSHRDGHGALILALAALSAAILLIGAHLLTANQSIPQTNKPTIQMTSPEANTTSKETSQAPSKAETDAEPVQSRSPSNGKNSAIPETTTESITYATDNNNPQATSGMSSTIPDNTVNAGD